MKSIALTFLFLFFGLNDALAQPGPDVPHPRFGFQENTNAQPMAPLTVFDIAIGASDYPILEMPLSINGELRLDGSSEKQDLKRNQGALLNLALSRTFPTKFANYKLGAGVHRAATVPGGGLPTPSSYVRVHAELSAHVDLSSIWYRLAITPAIEARRSMYRNVESGHYVDGILFKSAIAKNLVDRWQGEFSAGYAPFTRFGLIQPAQSGKSGALADSSANMSEISGKLIWSPNQRTHLHLCAAQESVNVIFNSTDGYSSYGLPVATLDQGFSEKSFNLYTRYLTFGTSKQF
jgi:hypothetical protein